jgi:hypothetical protein
METIRTVFTIETSEPGNVGDESSKPNNRLVYESRETAQAQADHFNTEYPTWPKPAFVVEHHFIPKEDKQGF